MMHQRTWPGEGTRPSVPLPQCPATVPVHMLSELFPNFSEAENGFVVNLLYDRAGRLTGEEKEVLHGLFSKMTRHNSSLLTCLETAMRSETDWPRLNQNRGKKANVCFDSTTEEKAYSTTGGFGENHSLFY